MRRTWQLLLPLVVAVTMAGTLGIAEASGRARSTIEITKATGDTEHVEVKGTVSSTKSRCKRNRKVKVYHDSEPPYLIGETTTDDNGRWQVSSVALPDKVYAVVKKNKRCRGDDSPTEEVKFKP